MAEFVEDAGALAKAAMEKINPEFVKPIVLIIEFLIDNPELAFASKAKKAPEFGSGAYVDVQAEKFSKSRDLKKAEPMNTIPDEIVSLILNEYFNVPTDNLKDASHWHRLSMQAESIVGDVLERYIASVVEKENWAWCSGSLVKSIDFIHRNEELTWEPWQVKNRDNSENSSSSAIRKGTKIQKWHRSFSKKAGDNWSNFPIPDKLSEKSFRAFVEQHIKKLKFK